MYYALFKLQYAVSSAIYHPCGLKTNIIQSEPLSLQPIILEEMVLE